MTEKKKYKQICKKYRKELKKIAKDTYPWDYCFMMHYFETYLRFMQEYYDLGYNIMAMEDKDSMEELKEYPTRLESITKALNEYKAYCDLEYPVLLDCTTKEEQERKMAIYNKELNKHWNTFWNTVKNNIRGWWD